MTAASTTPPPAPASASHGAALGPPPGAEPAATLGSRLAIAAGDIKLSHSVFALPFAVLGAVLARRAGSAWSEFAGQLALVVLCMIFARTWAMLINRLADARFDAANPRTARRAVASGRLRRVDALVIALGCAAGFCGAAGLFTVFFGNPWPPLLAVPVLGWLALYSFAKRFTALCHLLLGTALAISPLAAALAVRPAALTDTPALWWLSGMVTLWVAGFDIIYALQDTEFDRATGLRSVPAGLGPRGAVWISRLLHAGAAGCLAGASLADARFGVIFGAAVVLAASLLVVEHAVLSRRGMAGLPMAFFTLNGVVSCVVGGLGVLDSTL